VGPNGTHEVPKECSLVRLVLITSVILEVMSHGTVDVAVEEDALAPVVVPVLDCSVLKVFRYFQDGGVVISVVFGVNKLLHGLFQIFDIAGG
jgi:hypothetical protein